MEGGKQAALFKVCPTMRFFDRLFAVLSGFKASYSFWGCRVARTYERLVRPVKNSAKAVEFRA